MQERQVTIGSETFPLPDPFLVMATQNPVEQEGTYPLPEAQLDRFLMKVVVDYPTRDEELQILRRMSKTKTDIQVSAVTSPEESYTQKTTSIRFTSAKQLRNISSTW